MGLVCVFALHPTYKQLFSFTVRKTTQKLKIMLCLFCPPEFGQIITVSVIRGTRYELSPSNYLRYLRQNGVAKKNSQCSVGSWEIPLLRRGDEWGERVVCVMMAGFPPLYLYFVFFALFTVILLTRYS